MEQTLEKTCLLISQLTNGNIDNLNEVSTGYLIP